MAVAGPGPADAEQHPRPRAGCRRPQGRRPETSPDAPGGSRRITKGHLRVVLGASTTQGPDFGNGDQRPGHASGHGIRGRQWNPAALPSPTGYCGDRLSSVQEPACDPRQGPSWAARGLAAPPGLLVPTDTGARVAGTCCRSPEDWKCWLGGQSPGVGVRPGGGGQSEALGPSPCEP